MEWQSTTWDGTLTVGSTSMHCPAWVTFDVHELWNPPDKRGQSLLIPGRTGRLSMPRRDDETTWSLPMLIAGDVDRLGAPTASLRAGYRANLAYLRANVRSTTSTRTVSLTLPAGGSVSAPAHVQVRAGEQTDDGWRAVLELTFPGGGLA